MSTSCSSYREHAWKKGKCADCSQAESAHKVASSTPASTGPARLSAVAAGRALFGGPAETSPKKPSNKPKISLALGNKAAVFGETVVKPTVRAKPPVVVFKASAGNKPTTTSTTTTTSTSINTAPVNSVSAAFSAFGAKSKSTAPVKSPTGTTLNETNATPIATPSNSSTSTSTSSCSSYIPHAFKKDTCRDCGRGVSVHAGVATTTVPSIDRAPSMNRIPSTTTPSKVTVTPAAATVTATTNADTKIESTASTPAQQTPGHSRKSSQTIWNSPGLNPFNAPSVNRRLSTDYDELLRESRVQAAEFLATHSATASAAHSRSPSTLGIPAGSDFLSQLSLASATLTNAQVTNANTASRPTTFTAPKAATNNNTSTKPATTSEPKTTTAGTTNNTAVKSTTSEPKPATTYPTATANTCTSYAAHAFKKNTCMNCGKSESTHSIKTIDAKPIDAKISTPPSIDRKMSIRDRVSSLGDNINLAALQGREYIPSTHTSTDGTPVTEIGDVDISEVQHHGSFKRASASHKHPSTTRKLSFVPPKRTSTESVAPADITIVSTADTTATTPTPPVVADATTTSTSDITVPDVPAPTIVPGTEIKTETILTPSLLLTDMTPSRPTNFKAPRKTSTTTETTSVPTDKVAEKVEQTVTETQKTENTEFNAPNFHTDDVPNFHTDESSSIRSSGLRDLLDDDDHSTLANKATPLSSSQAPITTAITNTNRINLLAQDDDWETD